MYNKRKKITYSLIALILVLIIGMCPIPAAAEKTFVFTDDGGNEIKLFARPARVVSLIPSITEMIFKLGAGDALRGVTYHTTLPPEFSEMQVVGGYFSPSVEAINSLTPDLIIISSLHHSLRSQFNSEATVVELNAGSMNDIYRHLELLGRIFGQPEVAEEITKGIRDELALVREKVSRIPEEKRLKVMRLMGRDEVMTPGDDSFQNEFIRAAGGQPPQLGRNGAVTVMSLQEWQDFSPEVIYGCGGARKIAELFFSQPDWRDAPAVKNDRIYNFPCDLTCRASVNSAYFVSWLASTIYPDEFAQPHNQVRQDRVVDAKNIPASIDLPYVRAAEIVESSILDTDHKTLLIHFNQAMPVISTLEGPRDEISTVGNHYFPRQFWAIGHKMGLKAIREHLLRVLDLRQADTSLLITGANMDNLAVKKASFKDMTVYALATAGVKSNALHMSRDEGRFYEPGTINIIILPNVKLSPRAITRAIISATEAKTAAMQDLDVRSTKQPLAYQATGTGTDNIIVAQGDGVAVDNASGHSKLGELIATAAYQAVTEAVYRQNGLVAKRNIFQRLKERKLDFYTLTKNVDCPCQRTRSQQVADLQNLLLKPRYAAFLESALVMSDAWERGLISDLNAYQDHCRQMANEIAGQDIEDWRDNSGAWPQMTPVMAAALNALFNGLGHRTLQGEE